MAPMRKAELFAKSFADTTALAFGRAFARAFATDLRIADSLDSARGTILVGEAWMRATRPVETKLCTWVPVPEALGPLANAAPVDAPAGPVVFIVGAESTGKTTLTRNLAAALHVPAVPEYARTYAEAIGRELSIDDVTTIARGQFATEWAVGVRGGRGGVIDAPIVATAQWSQALYGRVPEIVKTGVRRALNADAGALWLLTSTGVPFEPDPVRSLPIQEAREVFHAELADAVEAAGIPLIELSGSAADYLVQARFALRERALWG